MRGDYGDKNHYQGVLLSSLHSFKESSQVSVTSKWQVADLFNNCNSSCRHEEQQERVFKHTLSACFICRHTWIQTLKPLIKGVIEHRQPTGRQLAVECGKQDLAGARALRS